MKDELKGELEHRWHDLGAFIRDQRKVGHLSLRKLSDMAGISNPYLSQIERGLRKPSAEILQQIARALSISAETLYVRAGILEERDGTSDLADDIRRDGHLTEDQKRTLVRIYESFCHENGGVLVSSSSSPPTPPPRPAAPAPADVPPAPPSAPAPPTDRAS